MTVGLDSIQVLLEHVHLADSDSFTLALLATYSHDRLLILGLVQAWHVTRVKDSVNILKHILIDDLGIDKQESGGFCLNTTLHKHGLQVVAPITHLVTLYHFDLEALV